MLVPSSHKESNISIYLNEVYYVNDLTEKSKEIIVNGKYKAAPLNYISSNDLSSEIEYAKKAIWQGKVVLIDTTEYIRASTNDKCLNMYSGSWNTNSSFCSKNNWLYLNDIWWTISPYSQTNSGNVWFLRSGGDLYGGNVAVARAPRPVVTLSSKIQIVNGNGSEISPFEFRW